MAKVKVINTALDQNLNGGNFNNTPSETIFSFGDFQVTSNTFGRDYINYENTLSSFVRVVTLDTMGVTETQSATIHSNNTNAVLNLDKSDLGTFVRFGSAQEFLRVSVESIITKYPASLYASSDLGIGGNVTYLDYYYDIATNTSTFKVPNNAIVNIFGISYGRDSNEKPNDDEMKNMNLSYDKYIVWTKLNPSGNEYKIIEYTGNSSGADYINLKVEGNPFYMASGTSNQLDFHIKPNNFVFEEYRSNLSQYEQYIIASRDESNGFKFGFKEPLLNENGKIEYVDTTLVWYTSDGYNIDINTPKYNGFLNSLLTIGAKFDKVKTDLIARFLTPSSLKVYDLTAEGKITKLLRLYGREFDDMKQFIDSLVNINKVTYDKIDNVPDQLIKNLSKTLGWDYFSLLNEDELVESFLTIDDTERDLNKNLLPAEIDIELWRRIIMNTNYFWKTKGTREAIKSIFLLIGIPEPFINISEYVYTVEGKINPNTVGLEASDFPSNSLPYDLNGYPKAPLENSDFYFQTSGNTDSGQAYMNVFRQAGFNIIKTVDNKKTWGVSGDTYRVDDNTPQYHQKDSKLVLNTKETDISLDTARGIEFDIFDYIQTDYTINSSGYTLPYSYVNISLGYNGQENTFPLPNDYTQDKVMGDLEVRFNGILLNGESVDDSSTTMVGTDYTINDITKTFTLINSMYANNNTNGRDVIQATFIYSGGTQALSGITIRYIVTRVTANINGTLIPLPSEPDGDIQVTINGISLTRGNDNYYADYILDNANQQLVIQNPAVIAHLADSPEVQIAYIDVAGSDDIYARNEILRVDSFNSSKLYYNISADKYVYRLNYKSNNTSDIKVLIDGIALEPNTDYVMNPQDSYEVFLPSGIKYGSVISVYYIVGGNSVYSPVINDVFGIGDISELSFLEFIELIQRKLINVRNRKTITDFKGGWYPSLLRIYNEYLKRSKLGDSDPLQSNGYTFENLYSFLGKYSAFFQRFVDELVSPTIILRKSGLLVRNSIFTKQKFGYRRGTNLYDDDFENNVSIRCNRMYEYLGDDSAVFKIRQNESVCVPPLYVETKTAVATAITIDTGGLNVSTFDELTSYGVKYRCNENSAWCSWTTQTELGSLPNNCYDITIPNTTSDTNYEYKAFVGYNAHECEGNIKAIHTPEIIPLTPEIHTITGTSTVSSINTTGGKNIVRYSDTEYYGMQYRYLSPSTGSTFNTSPSGYSFSCLQSNDVVVVSGENWNTYNVVKNLSLNWLCASSEVTPVPSGVTTCVYVSENHGASRAGVLCYVPLVGDTKYVSIYQAADIPSTKPVYMTCAAGGCEIAGLELACATLDTTTDMIAGDCYSLTMSWTANNPAAQSQMGHKVNVSCNGFQLYTCTFTSNTAKSCFGLFQNMIVRYSDVIRILTCSTLASGVTNDPITTGIHLNSVADIIGNYCIGASPCMTSMTASTDGY